MTTKTIAATALAIFLATTAGALAQRLLTRGAAFAASLSMEPFRATLRIQLERVVAGIIL
jgi:hypothetical protein